MRAAARKRLSDFSRSGCYKTREVVPPCGVGDKDLEYARDHYPGKTKGKISVPRPGHQPLDQKKDYAED